MRFEGTVVVRAAREAVWRFLTDPTQVSQCAPGVSSLEVLGPERFRARAAVGFGSVKAQFVTEAEWRDVAPPERARMQVHGTAPGSAVDASTEMHLSDGEPGTTVLRWSADVNVVGTLASLAARLMGSVAQRLTDAFFEAVRQRIEALAAEAPRTYRFGPRPIEQAQGAILARAVVGADGGVVVAKGRVVTAEDVEALRAAGCARVDVAEPGSGDVPEDQAARRVAQAAAGTGLDVAAPDAGRACLIAAHPGLVSVDPGRLWQLNSCPGLAMATRREHALVAAGEAVATLKVLPFALPGDVVRQAERVAGDGGPLLSLRPLRAVDVMLLVTGSARARESGVSAFEAPLRARIEAWGSRLRAPEFITGGDEAEERLAERLAAARAESLGMLLIAGESAVLDRHDLVPRAVERAGGEVAAFGAPVDPGPLLLLAYLDALPVVALPACARSPRPNVVDLVLPRLLAGERLGPLDLVTLGHGGLCDDVAERSHPR